MEPRNCNLSLPISEEAGNFKVASENKRRTRRASTMSPTEMVTSAYSVVEDADLASPSPEGGLDSTSGTLPGVTMSTTGTELMAEERRHDKAAVFGVLSEGGTGTCPRRSEQRHASPEAHHSLMSGGLFAWTRPVPCEPRPYGPQLSREAEPYRAVEDAIHYTFKDKLLLLEAFTHASYPASCRLSTGYMRPMAVLGDAVLKHLITTHLYGCLEPLSNKTLSNTRKKLECNRLYGYLMVRHGMHKYLRSCSRALNEDLVRYVQNVTDRDYRDVLAYTPPAPLADLFEALSAAVYIDSEIDMGVVWDFVYRLMKSHMEREICGNPGNVPAAPLARSAD